MLADPNALADEAETKPLPNPPQGNAVCGMPTFFGQKFTNLKNDRDQMILYIAMNVDDDEPLTGRNEKDWSNYYEIIIR